MYTRLMFSAHTQNGKLADCEETFSEFDKNCFGLESYSTPLNRHVLSPFVQHLCFCGGVVEFDKSGLVRTA